MRVEDPYIEVGSLKTTTPKTVNSNVQASPVIFYIDSVHLHSHTCASYSDLVFLVEDNSCIQSWEEDNYLSLNAEKSSTC